VLRNAWNMTSLSLYSDSLNYIACVKQTGGVFTSHRHSALVFASKIFHYKYLINYKILYEKHSSTRFNRLEKWYAVRS